FITILMFFVKDPGSVSIDVLKEICTNFDLKFKKIRIEFVNYRSKTLFFSDINLDIINEFIELKIFYGRTLSIFVNYYMCECLLSKMNFIYNGYRTSLNQDHLEQCLMITNTEIVPGYEEIISRFDYH
ncbi:MAG: hypothetical protein MHPSP_003696, partial [Paramarteilia canceri]